MEIIATVMIALIEKESMKKKDHKPFKMQNKEIKTLLCKFLRIVSIILMNKTKEGVIARKPNASKNIVSALTLE